MHTWMHHNLTMAYNSLYTTTGDVRVLMNGGSYAKGIYIFICAVTSSLGEAMLDVVVVHYLTTLNQQEVQSTGSAGMVRSAVIKPPNHPEGCGCDCKVRASSG